MILKYIELVRARTDPAARLKSVNAETKVVLEQLERDYKAPEEKVVEKKLADTINAAHYSTGMVAAGFTSTVMSPETNHEAAILDENVVRYQRIKKKGDNFLIEKPNRLITFFFVSCFLFQVT